MNEEHFLSLENVADRLGMSVQTVRRWIKTGRLRAYKPVREYRIDPRDLEAFLEARSTPIPPTNPPQDPPPKKKKEPSLGDADIEFVLRRNKVLTDQVLEARESGDTERLSGLYKELLEVTGAIMQKGIVGLIDDETQKPANESGKTA